MLCSYIVHGSEEMEAFDDLMMLIPAKMVQAAEQHRGFRPEEMRFRIGREPSLVYGGREHFLPLEKVSEDDLLLILQKATGASLYNAAQEIRQEEHSASRGCHVCLCGSAAELVIQQPLGKIRQQNGGR